MLSSGVSPRARPRLGAVILRVGLAALVMTVAAPASTSLAPVALARSAPESFADLAAKLLPAVVNISTSQSVSARGDRGGPDMPQFPPGSPFERFFRDFMERNRPPGGPPGATPPPRTDRNAPTRRSQSLGSGFIIDASGIVVTNNHVIDGADEITVTLHEGLMLKATLIGKDERTDIAVLKVVAVKPLPSVPFGDSDTARVGDWVLAIGNPFGLGGTVTAGIVSARGRDIQQGPYDNFIQTDAAINKGNSGGPLFNMAGEVVGINTAIYSPTGGSVGVGFSIPANLAKNVVAQLRDFGRARRGWLGVRIQQVTPDIAESVGLKEPVGAMIAGVTDGGPAESAKIRNGDIVMKFNDHEVRDMRSLPRIVADTEIGKQVPVVVWRDGKEVTLNAKVGELPDDQRVASAAPDKPAAVQSLQLPDLGLQLSPITAEARERFQLGNDQKGVLITGVLQGTTAGDKGLKPGDVIVEVQQEEVLTPADVQERVEKVRKANRRSVLMLVQTGDGLQWVPLSLSPGDRAPG
ncbi:MAG: DegQ family serine endoprotease [Acetobacteraceae bacterium]|nr:DegQ family serine endoprotease [Acetobacteraceae bacterium]